MIRREYLDGRVEITYPIGMKLSRKKDEGFYSISECAHMLQGNAPLTHKYSNGVIEAFHPRTQVMWVIYPDNMRYCIQRPVGISEASSLKVAFYKTRQKKRTVYIQFCGAENLEKGITIVQTDNQDDSGVHPVVTEKGGESFNEETVYETPGGRIISYPHGVVRKEYLDGCVEITYPIGMKLSREKDEKFYSISKCVPSIQGDASIAHKYDSGTTEIIDPKTQSMKICMPKRGTYHVTSSVLDSIQGSNTLKVQVPMADGKTLSADIMFREYAQEGRGSRDPVKAGIRVIDALKFHARTDNIPYSNLLAKLGCSGDSPSYSIGTIPKGRVIHYPHGVVRKEFSNGRVEITYPMGMKLSREKDEKFYSISKCGSSIEKNVPLAHKYSNGVIEMFIPGKQVMWVVYPDNSRYYIRDFDKISGASSLKTPQYRSSRRGMVCIEFCDAGSLEEGVTITQRDDKGGGSVHGVVTEKEPVSLAARMQFPLGSYPGIPSPQISNDSGFGQIFPTLPQRLLSDYSGMPMQGQTSMDSGLSLRGEQTVSTYPSSTMVTQVESGIDSNIGSQQNLNNSTLSLSIEKDAEGNTVVHYPHGVIRKEYIDGCVEIIYPIGMRLSRGKDQTFYSISKCASTIKGNALLTYRYSSGITEIIDPQTPYVKICVPKKDSYYIDSSMLDNVRWQPSLMVRVHKLKGKIISEDVKFSDCTQKGYGPIDPIRAGIQVDAESMKEGITIAQADSQEVSSAPSVIVGGDERLSRSFTSGQGGPLMPFAVRPDRSNPQSPNVSPTRAEQGINGSSDCPFLVSSTSAFEPVSPQSISPTRQSPLNSPLLDGEVSGMSVEKGDTSLECGETPRENNSLKRKAGKNVSKRIKKRAGAVSEKKPVGRKRKAKKSVSKQGQKRVRADLEDEPETTEEETFDFASCEVAPQIPAWADMSRRDILLKFGLSDSTSSPSIEEDEEGNTLVRYPHGVIRKEFVDGSVEITYPMGIKLSRKSKETIYSISKCVPSMQEGVSLAYVYKYGMIEVVDPCTQSIWFITPKNVKYHIDVSELNGDCKLNSLNVRLHESGRAISSKSVIFKEYSKKMKGRGSRNSRECGLSIVLDKTADESSH